MNKILCMLSVQLFTRKMWSHWKNINTKQQKEKKNEWKTLGGRYVVAVKQQLC